MPGPHQLWSLVRLSPSKIAVQGVVLTALVGGVAGYSALDKSVTLSVDGESRDLRAFGGGTVGDVLADEGIEIGAHDVVTPAADTDIDDGTRISVQHARLLTLEVDGAERQVWTTALTVGEALSELGVRSDRAYLSASRSRTIGRDGLEVDVRTPRKVTVVADGRTTPVTTTAATVKAALAEAKVSVRRQDQVSHELGAYPQNGQVLKVVRMDKRKAVTREAIDHKTVRRSTSSLYEGQTKVDQEGRKGVKRLTWHITLADGKPTGRELRARDTLRGPVDTVVLVGTRERPKPKPEPKPEPVRASSDSSSSSSSSSTRSSGSSSSSSSSSKRSSGSSSNSPSSDGLNWSALAACESGGDPGAISPAGYYGLYQFSQSTWNSVGGSGRPDQASASEQTYRAQRLYQKAGAGQWPVCGKRL